MLYRVWISEIMLQQTRVEADQILYYESVPERTPGRQVPGMRCRRTVLL